MTLTKKKASVLKIEAKRVKDNSQSDRKEEQLAASKKQFQ